MMDVVSADSHEGVRIPSNGEYFYDLGQGGCRFLYRVDIGVAGETKFSEGLQATVKPALINDRGVARDYPESLEPVDTPFDGSRGQLHAFGDIQNAAPTVLDEQPNNDAINFIYLPHISH